jgi:glycosyltransferase involved in cell wall biosynthesis
MMRSAYRRHDRIDLHHINWLQCALPLPSDGKPALVTVLGNDMRLLRLPCMRMMLKRALRGRRVVICPNADWMRPELARTFGNVAMVRTVPFGIDPRWYAMARRFEESSVSKWLCVSRLTAQKLGSLFDWTAPFFARGGAQLHLLGPMQENIDLPPWVHWHGPASPDELCETWFPQAQGLITLSQHAEGRPQVMLEAMASGIPIIASRLPAHDDLLGQGGGILCATAGETLAALNAMSDSRENRAVGQVGRARVREELGTWDDCANRYATLYRELLGDAGA